MSKISAKWQACAPYLLSVLRIMAALIFITSGTTILFGFPAPMPGGEKLVLMSQVGIGGILEFVGGLLMLVGLCTRPVAFVLAGMMAVAYFQFHVLGGKDGPVIWPTVNNGVPAVLYCFIWLYYSAAGAGKWSLDEMLGKNK